MRELDNNTLSDRLLKVAKESPAIQRALEISRRVQYSALARFEDPTGLERPLWHDVSHWQGEINFELMKASGAHGVIIKATEGYLVDPMFEINWRNATDADLLVAPYHYFWPYLNVKRQVENHLSVAQERGDICRWWDVETASGLSATQVADRTREASDTLLNAEGERPGIYSRYLLIDEWFDSWSSAMMNSHWWWLAQYLFGRVIEHAGPPTLPDNLDQDRILLHQTADKKPGPVGMVQSASVDWDRWELGNEREMYQFIADNFGGDIPIPGDDLEERVLALEASVVKQGADIKALKGITTNLAGEIGDIIEILEGMDTGSAHEHHIEPTHRVVTDRPNGIKLRAYPKGTEAAMLKNGHLVKFLKQTRQTIWKLVAAEVNGVIVTGWVEKSEIRLR